LTLNSVVVVLDPVNPQKLFDFTLERMVTDRSLQAVRWDLRRDPSRSTLSTLPGQGLMGWLFVHYCENGPYLTEEEHVAEWEDDDYPYPHPGPVFAQWSIDTTYTAKAPNGAGCSDMHAWLISEVGAWLDGQNIRWRWKNEFTGEWHEGVDTVSDLGDPVKGNPREPEEVAMNGGE